MGNGALVLWQRTVWLAITAYAAIASPAKFSSFAFMFSLSRFTRFLILGMHFRFRNPRRNQVAPIMYNLIITQHVQSHINFSRSFLMVLNDVIGK